MTATRSPSVIAFHAYKGGTGRTTALVHTAWALARGGRRVVMMDFDLAAPSLWHIAFPDREPQEGFVEYFARSTTSSEVRVADYLYDVKLDGEATGQLRLLGAGRMDAAYLRELSGFDWQRLLDLEPASEAGGARSAFQRLRDGLAPVADAILVDVPAGLNDAANVCLRRLADVVVVLFAPDHVQMEGVGRVVSLLAEEKAARGRPDVICVASTIHAHGSTPDQAKRVERAFQYLARVRDEALDRPERDPSESSRIHVPYEPALADAEDIRLDGAPDEAALGLYEELVQQLDAAVRASR